jgi:ribosomal protein S18 acetylase RimI-like enzyme
VTARTRFMLAAALRPAAVADDPQARPPTPDDATALGALMLEAYRGTLDDEGENLEDAQDSAAELLDGGSGLMLWDVSEVIERAGVMVAATLVTRWEGLPFVAFLITAPSHQRQGLGRAGMQRAINRLAAAGETVLRLVVTQGNAPAEALYESLGFRPEARPPLTTG